ncbi:MAG: rhodanese-like domain-containing protein [Candidatus Muiribacteriota bacterium]
MNESLEIEYLSMADVLKEMDIEFIVMGEYGITVEDAAKFLLKDHFLFLDVRTKEEKDHLSFSFAKHIPLNELPDRVKELNRNKFIITFCVSGFRAAMAYAYLRTQGFDEIKALKGRLDELAGAITPERFYRLSP